MTSRPWCSGSLLLTSPSLADDEEEVDAASDESPALASADAGTTHVR